MILQIANGLIIVIIIMIIVMMIKIVNFAHGEFLTLGIGDHDVVKL
jgi:hypothetical protein